MKSQSIASSGQLQKLSQNDNDDEFENRKPLSTHNANVKILHEISFNFRQRGFAMGHE
jgi:hypothetical protein